MDARITDLDTKLYDLEKENLKLKLSLPACIGAQFENSPQGIQNNTQTVVRQKYDDLQAEVRTMYVLIQTRLVRMQS